jgi:hypothetical protein
LPSAIANANWTQIAAQLDNPKSPYALSIDVAANHLIAAICKIDGGAPANVCSQTFAQVVSYPVNSPAGGAQLVVSDALLRGAAPSADASRFAPNRHVARV